MMGWENLQQHREQSSCGGILSVKVMTDEQTELLRKQIAVYATICQQLVEMYKAYTAQQDFTEMRLGNVYCDPLMTSSLHKVSTRHRWTPSPIQVQILEDIFARGAGTPSKQKIKDITIELSQHGPISESNVYNWFQNRRARSKRKQQSAAPSTAESEVETEVDSRREKRAKSENIQPNGNHDLREDEIFFQSSERSYELQSLDPQPGKGESTFPSDGCSNSSGNMGDASFSDSLLSSPRISHLSGNMEVSGSYERSHKTLQ